MANFESITDLPSSEGISPAELHEYADLPPLLWDFNLPPTVDAERLVVNMSALRLYQAVGAMRSGIVLDYQGDRTEFTPGVSGINPDGSAIATKAGVQKKADKSETTLIDSTHIPQPTRNSFGKPIVVHRLNKAEMAQNIGDSIRDKGLNPEEAWANQLDISLRDSFRMSGKMHLVDRDGGSRYIDYTLVSLWGGLIASQSINHPDVLVTATLAWTGVQAIFTGAGTVVNKLLTGDLHLDEKRWSIFFGFHQSDRYVALNGLSRVSKLVSVRK